MSFRSTLSHVRLLRYGRLFALLAGLAGGLASPPALMAAPGDVDPTFSLNATYYSSPTFVQAIAVQADGKILIGGQFATVDNLPRTGVARLNQDGSLDPTFAPNFYDAYVTAIHVDQDGSILIAGRIFLTSTYAGLRQIVRVSTTGALLNDFNLSSTQYDDDSNIVTSMLVEPNGSMVIGGGFFWLRNAYAPGLARLSADGTVLTTLGATAGLGATTSGFGVYGIARAADGKLVIGGDFITGSRRALVRLNTDGSIDTDFAVANPEVGSRVNTVAVESGGTILVGGTFDQINSGFTPRLARLNADGTLNESHQPTVLYYMGAPSTVRALADGTFLLGGILGPINNTERNGIARFKADWTLDAFYPAPGGVNGEVRAIGFEGDGSVLIGGYFTTVGGLSRPTMARLLDTPNNAPQLTDVSVTPSVNEGGTVTLGGTVSDADAGDTLTLTVNWGDNTLPESFTHASGSNFTHTHQYLDDNPSNTNQDVYAIGLSLSDGRGGSATASTSTTVLNVAPSLSNLAASPSTLTAGSSTTLSGTVGDAGTLDPHSITIGWGDGSTGTTVNLLAGVTSFSAVHQYSTAGSYTVTVTVADDDLGQTSGSLDVTVTPPAPAAPAAPSNVNGVVSVTRSGKTKTYAGAVTWTDNSSNETGFLIQRYVKSKKSCAIDTAFGTKSVGQNVTAYQDPTATASTCGYQVAATNDIGQSLFVRDLNISSGTTP